MVNPLKNQQIKKKNTKNLNWIGQQQRSGFHLQISKPKQGKGCGLNYKTKQLLLTSVLKSASGIHRDIPDGFGIGFEIGRLAGVADDTAGAAHPKEETNHPTEEQNHPTEVNTHRTEENNFPT